jgi:hypothetical protein
MFKTAITPFKGREIDLDKQVDVYRCLTRKGRVFSIRQNSLVVAHCTSLEVKNAKFIVNPSGKKRAIKSSQRNVHAFIRGKIWSGDADCIEAQYSLKYNPFSEKGFYLDGEEVRGSRMVTIREHGVYALKPL